MSIKPALALAAFAVLPFMFLFAYYMNGKMRRAFRSNRERIADINAQIEDNLSGIRVVKSFANEDIEKKNSVRETKAFCAQKEQLLLYGKFLGRTWYFYDPDPGKCHTCGCHSDRKGKCGYQ